MAEFNDLGFNGPFVEMTDTPSRDETLATGWTEPRTLHVGRDAVTDCVAIVVNRRHRFTLSEEVKQQLIKWLEAL